MNTTQENINANTTQASGTEVKKKRSFFRAFLSFLMYGGWILMIIIIVGIVIAVQILTK
jgi:hypothetical protein